MSDISVDHSGMARLLAAQSRAVEMVENSLDKMPGAFDGGVASAMIGLLSAAAAESAAIVIDSQKILIEVTAAALEGWGRTEEQIQQEISEYATGLDER